MTALIVIGVYLVIGAISIRLVGPLMWAKANEQWYSEDIIRESVIAQSFWWLFLWPFMLIWTFLIAAIGKEVDRSNPKRLRIEADDQRRRIAEQQRRIAELEDELGMR